MHGFAAYTTTARIRYSVTTVPPRRYRPVEAAFVTANSAAPRVTSSGPVAQKDAAGISAARSGGGSSLRAVPGCTSFTKS